MAITLEEVRQSPHRTPFNLWRRETPGTDGWSRTPRAEDPNRYFMFSADSHAVEPQTYLDGIEPEYRARTPHREVRPDGSEWLITEGTRPQRMRAAAAFGYDPTPGLRRAAAADLLDEEDVLRDSTGRTVDSWIADNAADGIDAALMFPSRGMLCFATPDPVFAMAMCRQWNRWAHEFCGAHMQGDTPRILPAALIAAGDQEGAMREIRWAVDHGFRAVCLGNEAVFGPKTYGKLEYNQSSFDPMWSLLEETGLVVTFHVATGRDPRAVGGDGGAIINYVCHSMSTTIEPLVQLIASGVFERHPGLCVGIVESGIGFVPWMIATMDQAHRAHHFWVRPTLKELPSFYFRRNCFATFQDDVAGLLCAESLELTNNFLWANDYPHHEGSWPHSALFIERQMGRLSEASRAKILGENAARIFKLDPARYRSSA